MNEDDGEFDCNVSGTMGSAANANIDRGKTETEQTMGRRKGWETDDMKAYDDATKHNAKRQSEEISQILYENSNTSYVQMHNMAATEKDMESEKAQDSILNQRNSAQDFDREKSHESLPREAGSKRESLIHDKTGKVVAAPKTPDQIYGTRKDQGYTSLDRVNQQQRGSKFTAIKNLPNKKMIGGSKTAYKSGTGRDAMKAAGYLVFGEPQSDGSEMVNIEAHLQQNSYNTQY